MAGRGGIGGPYRDIGIVLLFVVLLLIQMFQSSWFKIDLPFVHGDFNGHSVAGKAQ